MSDQHCMNCKFTELDPDDPPCDTCAVTRSNFEPKVPDTIDLLTEVADYMETVNVQCASGRDLRAQVIAKIKELTDA